MPELVARYPLIGDRPSQAAYAVPAQLAVGDPVMAAFERWVRGHPALPFTVGEVASALWASLNACCNAPASGSPGDRP